MNTLHNQTLFSAIRNHPQPPSPDELSVRRKLSTSAQSSQHVDVSDRGCLGLDGQISYGTEKFPYALLKAALHLTNAGSAGISLLEHNNGAETLRCTYVAGAYKSLRGRTAPHHLSPCGLTMESGMPQLFSYPRRFFPGTKNLQFPIVELLVVPLPSPARAIQGTIWIIAHDKRIKFGPDVMRRMTSLAELTASALSGIALMTAEREARGHAEQQIEDRTHALRLLSRRLMQVQDEEHRRIARDLHDSVGQQLAALAMNLSLMENADRSTLRSLISESKKAVQEGMLETRTISHLLHPPLLDEAGIASAARIFVEEFSRRSGMPVEWEIPEDFKRLPTLIETALFRVLQECLTNIHRHSGSSKASVSLTCDKISVTLTIRDYGKGLPEHVARALRDRGRGLGVGLTGMRERMRELNGTLKVNSNSGGTTVTAIAPLNPR
jgi:signal transduction histidine kinase